MIANMSKASALVDVSKKRVNPFKELWTNKFLYLLALPAVVYTFIFSYLTLPYIVIAFEKFNYKSGVFSPFVGLKNFEYFFKSSWAWTVTRNTLVINILFLIVGTVCSVVLAIVLNEVKAKKFLKVSQSMMLFPYFISWVIVSYMLQGILGTETGLLNNLMGTRINYYSTPGYWYPILLILNIWKNTGYNTIVYLAAITGIGGGIIENGHLIQGRRGIGGEIGHYIINFDGVECPCGNRGCFERYGSTGALVRRFTENVALLEKLGVPAEDVNGKVIFDHLDDADVSATVNSWIDSIAFGIIGLVHIFNPEMVLIGGGISREDEHFIRPLREKILNGAMEQFAKDLEVEAAALGNNAGLLGACAYFRQNF